MRPTGIRLLLDKLPTPVGTILVLTDNDTGTEPKVKVAKVIKEIDSADVFLKGIGHEDIVRKLIELGYVEEVPHVNAEVIAYFGPILDEDVLK